MKKLFSSILISFILFTNLVVPVSVFAAVPTITFQFIADKVLASSDLRAWEVNINTTGIPDGNDVSITLFENGKDVTDKYTAVKINKNTGLYYSGYILKPATNYKITATTPGVSNSFERVTLGTAIPVNIPQEKTNPTDTYWFKDMDGAFRGVNGPLKLPGFATSKECEDAKKVYWTGFNSTDSTIPCSLITQEQVLANFEAEKIKNAKIPGDPAIPVTPKINVAENKSIYKMLVPLPGITCMDSSGQDPNCIPNDIGKYLNFIFKFAIGLCAALAVIMLIIAGVSYMGDESVFGKTEAKKKMFSAILGLIIALGAWALLNTINPALTGKGGLVIDSASITLTPTSGGGYYGVTIGAPGNPNANKNITTYDTQLKAAASRYGLSCTLLKSFMYAESGGVNNLTSPSGAQGLIQLMPGTFAEQGVGSDPMDAQTNIMAGASYLSKLQKNGCNLSAKSSVCDISNIQYLAASYNGGPGANKEATACPGSTNWQCATYAGYQQTRIYAPRVEANFNKLTANGWGC